MKFHKSNANFASAGDGAFTEVENRVAAAGEHFLLPLAAPVQGADDLIVCNGSGEEISFTVVAGERVRDSQRGRLRSHFLPPRSVGVLEGDCANATALCVTSKATGPVFVAASRGTVH